MPLVSIEIVNELVEEVFQDVNVWRKTMIHYIKEENPEINTAIIEAANRCSLDPKAIALGAYMAYKLLEMGQKQEGSMINDILE